MNTDEYLVRPKEKINLDKVPTSYQGKLTKDQVYKELIPENIKKMKDLQEKLYAENKQALLIVLQAMDAAGKDSLIKKIMTGLNPQGTHVASFKVPTYMDLDRDYLYRIHSMVPARGEIGIFNRSHYEDVIVTRVHNLVEEQPLPEKLISQDIWDRRFEEINNFEEYLSDNGISVVKFYLHISKDKQKERLMERLERPEKHWKFSKSDILERQHWYKYRQCYEDVLEKTSTKKCPWYVVPADRKWFSRYLVSTVILEKLEDLDPEFPKLSKDEEDSLDKWKEILKSSR